MNSSFVTVNCSAIETEPYYSSFATEKSSKPTEIQTLQTIITTHDGQTTILMKPTIIQEWETSTDEGPKASNMSRDAGNDNNTISMLLHVVLPIAGGLILIVLVSVTILCTRRCRNEKHMLRTKVSGSNSLGNSDPPFEAHSLGNSNHPFEVDNADGVHNYEEMREPQNSKLNLFPDIDTPKAMVQGYDYITFEKIPPKRVPNYDLMMENVDMPLSDSTYSHVPSETFSLKCFKPAEYSHINFDKTDTGEKLSVCVDRNGQSTTFDCYSHIEFESKPSVSIINPIGKSEQTISDNNSHTTLRSDNDDHHSSSRPEGTVVDGDSYFHLAFNAKQSRDDNDLDMTIRFGNIQNYNYAKVNREHKKQKPRDKMEIMQIGEVGGLDRTDEMEKGSENDDNSKVNL
ncbi:hypothetical protein CHS0354_011486 [Potamilus streckersoni]|uniref:Uncharacterized protein n=1 Tax=Potamilus streckersoni TaxID=2493646 RepID=A0AAE0VYH0_9BIVA|nr:hypothetical protein CHS0354_011486 [Potamilus streckersoni]